MKNTKIRTLSLIIAMLMALACLLVGCDKEEKQNNDSNSDYNSVTEIPDSSEEDENQSSNNPPEDNDDSNDNNITETTGPSTELGMLIASAIDKTLNANSCTITKIDSANTINIWLDKERGTSRFDFEKPFYDSSAIYTANGNIIYLNSDNSSTFAQAPESYAETIIKETLSINWDTWDFDVANRLNHNIKIEDGITIVEISTTNINEALNLMESQNIDEDSDLAWDVTDFYFETSFSINQKEMLVSHNVKTVLTDTGNKITQQTSYTFSDINSTSVVAPDWLTKYYQFDTNGNIIKNTKYNADNSIQSYTTYEYNDDGILLKETVYDSTDEISSQTIYLLDQNGNIIKTERTVFTVRTVPYPSQNTSSITIVFIGKQVFEYAGEFSYNNMVLLKETYYDLDGMLTFCAIYNRDENNILTSTTYYDSNNNVIYTENNENN